MHGHMIEIKNCLIWSAIIIFICFDVGVNYAQETRDSSQELSKPLNLAAELLRHYTDENGIDYDTLIGDVKISQDSLFLFCNRAHVREQSFVEAIGDVIILQGDSIQLFSDSLIYDDRRAYAQLFGEVVIKNGDRRLFTTEAEYDVQSKRAYYNNGATLFNQDTRLISEQGIYDVEKGLAFFRNKVTIQDSVSLLKTDSLQYDLSREVIKIISPTNMSTDSAEIYFENGYYDYANGRGTFYKKLQIETHGRIILADKVDYYAKEGKYVLVGYPVVKDDSSLARADSIIYYNRTDRVDLIGRAFYRDERQHLEADRILYNLEDDSYETVGASEVVDDEGRVLIADRIYRDAKGNDIAENNILFRDTLQDLELLGDRLISDSKKDQVKVYNIQGQPTLIQISESDSLLLKSDTLTFSQSREKGDTSAIYTGEQNVQFVKGDVSGSAEHLIFDSKDSIFTFTGSPYLWSDSTQVSGDTLIIKLSKGNIDFVKVKGNAFMIMKKESGTYDQVKGDEIINYLDASGLKRSDVDGNVELVYFMYQNGKLEGINHSLCGGLTFYFENNELNNIDFRSKPNSTFKKNVVQNDIDENNLQGFLWNTISKPQKETFLK